MPKAKTEKTKDPNLYVSIPREAFRSALYEILEQLRECAGLRQTISTQMDVLEDVEHSIRETVEKLNTTLYGEKWWARKADVYLDEQNNPPIMEQEYFPEQAAQIEPAVEVPPPGAAVQPGQQGGGLQQPADAPQNIPMQADVNAPAAQMGAVNAYNAQVWNQIWNAYQNVAP